MTLPLLALLIAGFTIKWYWIVGAVVIDLVWMSIKLNFFTILIRRSIEESKNQDPGPGV